MARRPREGTPGRACLFVAVAAGLLAVGVTAFAAEFEDADMELPDRGPWSIYGTPVTVEKSTHARSGVQSLRVVTDNKETMGGNYEGASHALGQFEAGDLLHLSFWYDARGGQSIVVGIGPTSFVGRWVLSGTDWTRADLTLRCPQPGPYNVWISQAGSEVEFYLDDFSLEVTKRPQLGEAADDRRMALTGGPLRLTLCLDTGALCGIENLATGETYAPVGQRQPLFGIEMLSADGLGYETVPFSNARLEKVEPAGADGADLTFTVPEPSIEIAVRIRLTGDGAAGFAGRVQNNSDRTVTGFELPMVYGVCPANDPDTLVLVDPYVCGRIVPDAIKSGGCQTAYPGRGVMGWMDLSGEAGGIYLATHDQFSTGTRLMALPAPGPSFDMAITKDCVVKPGQSWRSPEAVLAVHEGDWHASADRYRAWAQSWMQRPDLPDWIRRADGWVLTGIQNGIPFRRLPDIYRTAQWMGIDYLHVQGEGIDNMWFDEDGTRHGHTMTYLYPSPRFGTPGELKQAVDTIHEQGGHVMFYFLYERWTPSHSVSENMGTGNKSDIPAELRPPAMDFYYDNALVETPGGRPPAENPFMAIRHMCLDAEGWQEWMRFWAIDIYAKQFGADGFYWDVMGRGGPFRCYNSRHGHQGENTWAQGCAKVLETVIREGREINPDYSAAIEGCSDVLGQWNGFHLMSGATMNPNVFRYTFPEYLLVDGFSNTTWKLTHPQKARRVFLDGERFDIHGYDQRVKKIISLRKRIKPFIDWPAVFKDTVGLSISDARVQARGYVRTDGQNRTITVTMMNEEAVEGATVEVDLAPIGAAKTAFIFGLDGRVEMLAVPDGQTFSLPVPVDGVSAAVIVSQVEPALRVVAWLEQIMRPGDDGLALTLFAPLDYPFGEISQTVSDHGMTRIIENSNDVAPHLRRYEIRDADHLAGLAEWIKATADVRWQGGEVHPWTVLAPPLVNGNMEQVQDDGRLAYWGALPCDEDPAEGLHCIRVDTQSAPQKHLSTLTPVKPACRYRFRCMVRRSAAATGWAGAHVVEYEEGSSFTRSAVLNSSKVGEWESLETEFTSLPDPRSTAIYLYNFDEAEPAWFDRLQLEEIGG